MYFNKNFSIFALVVVALMVSALATPVPEQQDEPEHLEELEFYGRVAGDHSLVRMKRASCDLFSWTSDKFTPNHAVCAAHCIALGKRGGSCKGTVCHCRA